MCGRFTATWPSYDDLVRALGLQGNDDDRLLYKPRWNVAPTDPHWVVRLSAKAEERVLSPASWGFLPGAGSGKGPSYPLINARAETVSKLPAFKASHAKRRCVVPIDGFYEWIGPPKARRPIWFHAPEGGLLRLAGLWEPARRRDGGPEKEGRPEIEFTILTTAANDVVAPAHDRMPVILAEKDVDAWLFAHEEEDARLFRPAPLDVLTGTAVGSRVNKIAHDDPNCLLPWDAEAEEAAAEHAAKEKREARAAKRPAPKGAVKRTQGAEAKDGGAGETLSLFGESHGSRRRS